MENSTILPNIRIRKVTMTDFRNIAHSEVEIPGGREADFLAGEASVLGIYGQNGSGKTSLLMAINALKTALSGQEFLFSEFSGCVRSGCDHSRLEFEFSAYNDSGQTFEIYYSFSLSVEESERPSGSGTVSVNKAMEMMGLGEVLSENGKGRVEEYFFPQNKKIVIFDELLQCSCASKEGDRFNKQVIIDTSAKACKSSGKSFGNKAKYEQLTSNCEADIDEILYKSKIEATLKSSSFIFYEPVVEALIEGNSMTTYRVVLRSLSQYGRYYLFIILMNQTAANNMRMLPLSVWLDTGSGAIGLTLPITLFGHCQLDEDIYPLLRYSIDSISKVVSTIVPNLKIELADIGKTLSESGHEIHLFDLISNRGGIRIPLAYESDGIRRIVSIISLMIAVYNNPSVTVAIDEIDSGIFEYMLGELLSILRESGKGQIIFTSHNLRPLEVLPYKNLIFTTVNPDNRFSKLEGISGNNNKRDSYFRSVTLGNGENALYESTDKFSIEQALFEAGLVPEDD